MKRIFALVLSFLLIFTACVGLWGCDKPEINLPSGSTSETFPLIQTPTATVSDSESHTVYPTDTVSPGHTYPSNTATESSTVTDAGTKETPSVTLPSETIPGTETQPSSDPLQTKPADNSGTSSESDTETPSDGTAETPAVSDTHESDTVEPDKDEPEETVSKVADVEILGDGYDIYLVPDGWQGYRYGCTYLYNDNGSVDAYFACVGREGGEWDWISYLHSPNGGESWEKERIVLTPTKGSLDHFSICDPAVVYFNGYYYLGYTSTLNSLGSCNNLFVSRSKTPDGPFEKWNGSGWGGDKCVPIVYYHEDYNSWGIGEPSFVVVNDTLYMYYTNSAPSEDYMMVATADATDENWPATLQNHGVACIKPTDSIDVKYVEEWDKFIGVGTGERMTSDSWLGIYESNDGLKFELVDVVRKGTYSGLHNAGISSRPNGHIVIGEDEDKLRVIYAYGDEWAAWNTRVQPISLSLADENDMISERLQSCLADPKNRAEIIPEAERHMVMIRPEKDSYYYTLADASFDIALYQYDTYFDKRPLTASGAKFEVHNKNVITVSGSTATIVGVGTTGVVVEYGDCRYLFYVTVTEEKINSGSADEAIEFVPVYDTYTVYIGERSRFHPQIRAVMIFADGSFTEYYCDNSDVVVEYTGYDNSIISVSENGIVTAKAVGGTMVTLNCNGKTCTVNVIVSDDIEDSFLSVGIKAGDKTVDYTNIDFSDKESLNVISGLNQSLVSYDKTEKALKAYVKGDDPFFTVTYNQSIEPLTAEQYKKIEVTYMVPDGVSAKAAEYQMFFCSGDVTAPSAAHQTKALLECDGKYHTLTVDLTQLSAWSGYIHSIRMDFYTQAEVGDSIYIKSIKLLG